MNRALDVAKYVIDYSNKQGYEISNLKLQKILYFIQAEFLVETQEACFSEDIEAWAFGPVIPEVYRYYKSYGYAHISAATSFGRIQISEKAAELIERIIELFREFSAMALVDLTHKQDPWLKAYKPKENCTITTEEIKKYFE